MTIIEWEEWDGSGFDEAYAWTPGNQWNERDVWLALKRLGIDPDPGTTVEFVRGHVGKFDGEDEWVACNAMGVSWADDDESVTQDTICPATFAVFVDRE